MVVNRVQMRVTNNSDMNTTIEFKKQSLWLKKWMMRMSQKASLIPKRNKCWQLINHKNKACKTYPSINHLSKWVFMMKLWLRLMKMRLIKLMRKRMKRCFWWPQLRIRRQRKRHRGILKLWCKTLIHDHVLQMER